MARRVYFAFHYKDVEDFRANVVRNHHIAEGTEKAGYFDASIWEDAKKKDPSSLKRLINSELENTTVTVILIGTETHARRWVRYEIFKSIERGNTLLGIHINSIKDKDQKTKVQGSNPFDSTGLRFSADGRTATPIEWNGTKWVDSADHGSFTLKEPRPPADYGQSYKLSRWFGTKDWVADDGYNNFNKWIE